MGLFSNKPPIEVADKTVAGTDNRDAVARLKAKGQEIVKAQHERGSQALQGDKAPRGYRGGHRA